MNTRTWIGLGLLAAALASGWSVWRQRARPHATVAAGSVYDYSGHDVRVRAYAGDSGALAGTLQAPLVRRRRNDQSVEIQTPLFLLPDGHGRDWRLTAERGVVDAHGEQLQLSGDVRGDSPVAAAAVPTRLRTEALTVFPRRHQARSEARVSLSRPGILHTGTGLQLDLHSHDYSLLSQVKTRYEPLKAR